MTKSLEATERECAEGRTAPRVSLDDIKAQIAEVHYFTAAQALEGRGRPFFEPAFKVLTIALVAMNNGFIVVGKATPASPEKFNEELGRTLAYEDAVRQIWPLMGYALRDKLAGQ